MLKIVNTVLINDDKNIDTQEMSEEVKEEVKSIAENKPSKKTQQNTELDIASEQFNPLRALYAKDYKITTKKPKILYQNIAAFESAIKKVGILKLDSKNINETKNNKGSQQAASSSCTGNATLKNLTLSATEDVETTRRFLPHQYPVHALHKFKHRHKRNIFKQISSIDGPQSRLQYYIEQQSRIQVNLRTNKGVQGFVEGRLKVFDKHWNMVLTEVLETWKRRKYKFGENKVCGSSINCDTQLQLLGIQLPKQDVKSLNRKNVEVTRNISQLLVRGEQVVLVALLNKKED